MQAIQYNKSIPRYLLVHALSKRAPGIGIGPLGCIRLVDLSESALPAPGWIRVRPRLTGICGSDLATVRAEGSPYFSPLTSTPFVLGHEIVGTLDDATADLPAGSRVVIEPALHCRVRGIEAPCAPCLQGHYGNCENVMRGCLAPGIQTGYCRDTGGGWSHGLVAHPAQLYAVPAGLTDEEAVLAEPFSCALHAVLSARCAEGGEAARTILVIGCGTMGLLTIAALRALGNVGCILAIGKHSHQVECAMRLGANEVIAPGAGMYAQLAERLNTQVLKPEVGKPTVIGGADLTFDCVGKSQSIDDALRFTRARGQVMLVGMPATPKGVDWTTIWYKELHVRGSYTYGWETFEGKRVQTFDLALRLMAEKKVEIGTLVTHRFRLEQYREALRTAMQTGMRGSIKTVFEIGGPVMDRR